MTGISIFLGISVIKVPLQCFVFQAMILVKRGAFLPGVTEFYIVIADGLWDLNAV